MNPEGQLTITLRRRRGAGPGVSIDSSRPLVAARLLSGRRPAEVVRMVPLLYTVCGVAQAAAAATACERAAGVEVSAEVAAARDLLVWLESAREHLWRVVIDWPQLIGGGAPLVSGRSPPTALPGLVNRFRSALFGDSDPFSPGARLAADPAAIVAARHSLQQLLQEQLFAMPVAQWLAIAPHRLLDQWLPAGESGAARLLSQLLERGWGGLGASFEGGEWRHLPPLDGDELERCLTSDHSPHFVAQPKWRGSAWETTPLSRNLNEPLVERALERFGDGVVTRMLARLVELVLIAARVDGWISDQPTGRLSPALHAAPSIGDDGMDRPDGAPAVGLAQVEAARGRLIHRVGLVDHPDGARIGSYTILAPTEWNFHPDGVVARMLGRLEWGAAEQLRAQSALIINAVDPCVGYRLQLADGDGDGPGSGTDEQ